MFRHMCFSTLLLLSISSANAECNSRDPMGIIVVATDTGKLAVLDKCDPTRPIATFRAFEELVGVNLAVADVNNDGAPEIIVAAGPGGGPHVRVFSAGGVRLFELPLDPYPGFTGGVRVAAGDVNGDGQADIITAPGPGAEKLIVRVFDFLQSEYRTPDISLQGTGFTGGVFVAAGDIDGDGGADIIVGGNQGSTARGVVHVILSDGSVKFEPYEANFVGGVRVATGDINGDGLADIITGAGTGGGPHVKIFSGASGASTAAVGDFAEIASFFTNDLRYVGGINVAASAGASGADGSVVFVTDSVSSGSISAVRIFRSDAQVQWLMPFPRYKGGLTVAVSGGAMSKTPARSRVPGGLKIEETW